MSAETVTLQNVGKTWCPVGRPSVEALRDFSIDIEPGEFIVLLGPSGCGKSTLLYMLAGLEDISTGTIREGGREITGPSPDRGLIFQEAALFPWLTIAQNVSFGLSIQGLGSKECEQRARELLRSVGLGGLMDKKPDELSGGMRQRAACARALAMRPKLLMMDEPFAALDVQTRAKMQDFLLQLWQDSGASIVLVTHSIDEAIALADRVVVFTARPGTVKTIVPIDIPRPRASRDLRVHELRDQFTELLADEVDRAFAEQEAL